MASDNRDVTLVEYASGPTAVIELVRGTAVHSHRLEARGVATLLFIDVSPDGYDTIFRRELDAVASMVRAGSASSGGAVR